MGAFSSKGNIPVTRLHTLNEQTTSTMRQLSLLLLLSVAMLCSASTLRVKRDAMAKSCRHHQDCEITQACSQEQCINLCFCDNCNKGVNNARDSLGWTPLHRAAKTNSVFAAKLLLENSAEVNSASNHGLTALHEAALKNSVGVAKLLLENSANVDSTEKNGETPLLWAAIRNRVDIAKLLLANSANVNVTAVSGSWRGQTPVYWAKSYRNQEMVELLCPHMNPSFYICSA